MKLKQIVGLILLVTIGLLILCFTFTEARTPIVFTNEIAEFIYPALGIIFWFTLGAAIGFLVFDTN